MTTLQETGGTEHPVNASDWWKVYGSGAESAKPGYVTVDELTSWFETMTPGNDFVVVDVRRADCDSMIPTAINLPAQSLRASMLTLLPYLSSFPKIVFHCNSSKGRGTRAAGWLADALARQLRAEGVSSEDAETQISKQVLILTGGVVAWIEKHGTRSLDDRGKEWDGRSLCTIHL